MHPEQLTPNCEIAANNALEEFNLDSYESLPQTHSSEEVNPG
jgi:hypothetical protein